MSAGLPKLGARVAVASTDDTAWAFVGSEVGTMDAEAVKICDLTAATERPTIMRIGW